MKRRYSWFTLKSKQKLFANIYKESGMALHPNAGKLANQADHVNVPKIKSAYYLNKPHEEKFPEHRVAFGTSGHR
ncbi:hypothetical protein, partial [Pseudoalteromonas ruthenica]|uniref:hypothetical protein n=1 Tax=Pseudoalteromonas ruthenica TaxID=151081 RepID=UPI001BB21F24